MVLPLKRVKSDFKEKLKRVDYLGSLVMLAASILILLPLSWYVCGPAVSEEYKLMHRSNPGEERSMLGAQLLASHLL